jgi:ubiquitin carboxyl-terminal hydrolase 4/11/15
MGYNQHDSQELATYLLDALHEDTNRVTKKPYIEKPEQSENETDEEAASKAWDLHLQRENSRVLESFMGQVKSRVECPHSHCGRVSTTFDPFMYLSVPLPGATDRTMKIVFVPLDPKICKKYVQITLLKSSTISDLCRKIADKVNEEMNSEHPITFRDICVTEMWNNEVYNFFKDTDSIDKIKDSDETYAFQVDTVESIQKYSINNTVMSNSEECPLSDTDVLRNKTYQLDESTKSSLDNDDAWRNALESFLMQPIYLNTLLNPKRNSHEERTTFRLKVSKFLDECTACSEYQTTSDTMETRKTIESAEDLDNNEKNSDISLSISLEPSDKTETLQQLCSSSTSFKNISSCKDVAILEYSMTKFWEYSLDLLKEQQQKFENGVEIQVIMKKITKFFSISIRNSICISSCSSYFSKYDCIQSQNIDSTEIISGTIKVLL